MSLLRCCSGAARLSVVSLLAVAGCSDDGLTPGGDGTGGGDNATNTSATAPTGGNTTFEATGPQATMGATGSDDSTPDTRGDDTVGAPMTEGDPGASTGTTAGTGTDLSSGTDSETGTDSSSGTDSGTGTDSSSGTDSGTGTGTDTGSGSTAGAGDGAVGDDCAQDSECMSGVCWDFADYDATCGGAVCSVVCADDEDCSEAFDDAGAPTPDGVTCGNDGRCNPIGSGFGAFFCAAPTSP